MANAKSNPKVKSDISERKPLHGASTEIYEFGIFIILPSRIDGKPILLRTIVAHCAAKSLSLTVRFPIKTSGSGIIANRKNIGNSTFRDISFPKKNNTRPYIAKTNEKPDRKYILSKAQTICIKRQMIVITIPNISLDILVLLRRPFLCHIMYRETIGIRNPWP
jgi:hypothetical protein